jgi:hypothetical protein
MLPERATSADSTDSTGCAVRFNGYDEFVAAGLLARQLLKRQCAGDKSE